MKTTKLNSLTSLINKAFNNEAIDSDTAIETLDNFRDLLSDFARDSDEIATIRETLNLDTVDLQCEFETKVELLDSEIAQQLAYKIIEQNTFEQCLDLFRECIEIDVTEYFTVDELTEIFFKEQQNEVYDLETEKQLDCVIKFATKESYKYQAIVEEIVEELCENLENAVEVLDEVIYALKSLNLNNVRYIYDTVAKYVKDYDNSETINKLTRIMQDLIDVEVSEFSEQVIEAYETLDKEAFRRLSNEAYSDENSTSSRKQMIIENAWESNRDYAYECLEALEAMTDDELKEQDSEIKYLNELDQLVFDSSNDEFGKRFSTILARIDD